MISFKPAQLQRYVKGYCFNMPISSFLTFLPKSLITVKLLSFAYTPLVSIAHSPLLIAAICYEYNLKQVPIVRQGSIKSASSWDSGGRRRSRGKWGLVLLPAVPSSAPIPSQKKKASIKLNEFIKSWEHCASELRNLQ